MRCLITGAADGIGRALAHRFASAGYTIIGIDIDAARAEHTQAEIQAQGGQIEYIIADLAQESEIARLLATLAHHPTIDVCIHNAGINAVGPFATIPLAHQQRVIAINLLAPMQLTAGLLRQRQCPPGSSLVFIASLSHFVGYPGAAAYAASKDGLASYARSLSVAYARQRLHVLTVYPGPTRTAHARRYSPDNSREGQRMPPEQLAAAIFTAVQRRQRLLIPGPGNWFLALVGHTMPWLTEWVMQKTIFEKVRSPHV